MRVQMRVKIAGSRDGVDWPLPGECLDVPDAEAADLIANGMAVPAMQPGPETAAAPTPENAAASKPRRRAPRVEQ